MVIPYFLYAPDTNTDKEELSYNSTLPSINIKKIVN